MAIAWLSVLQAVPWSDVIANAPKVAEGAKKLWSTVAKKPPPTAAEPSEATSSDAISPHAQAQALAALENRMVIMEEAATQVHEQLLASSELIKALAEQNAQLIQRIESNRARVVWLTGVAIIGAFTGLVALTLAWGQRLG